MKAGKILFRIAVLLVCVAIIFVGNMFFSKNMIHASGEYAGTYYKAKVLSIEKTENNEYLPDGGEPSYITVYFTVQIISKGVYENRIIKAEQGIILSYGAHDPQVQAGDVIVVYQPAQGSANQEKWYFSTFYRTDKLLVLLVVFVAFLLAVGGIKGLTSLMSLVITFAAIFFVYIPGILSGYNIYMLTVGLGFFSIIGSLLILDGFNKKTAASILGNISGVALTGAIGFAVNRWMGITGIVNEEYNMLLWVPTPTAAQIDLRALVWGAMLIGSLGAIMDVCMSIASALQELAENMQDRSFAKMFKSGMNIGKDAIGTMTNTLILAYIGGSLALVLLIIFNTNDLWRIFNFENITTEIIQSIVGSMGILVAVPLTALFSAYIFSGKTLGRGGPPRQKASRANALGGLAGKNNYNEEEYEDGYDDDYDDEQDYD